MVQGYPFITRIVDNPRTGTIRAISLEKIRDDLRIFMQREQYIYQNYPFTTHLHYIAIHSVQLNYGS